MVSKDFCGLHFDVCRKFGQVINKARFADDSAIIAKTQEELQDMVNKLVDTGRKYGMEISIDKSQVMTVSMSN